MKKNYHALIDADILIYQAAYLAEKNIYWGAGLWTRYAYVGDAINVFDTILDSICKALAITDHTHDVSMALSNRSSSDNFRKDILPTYKQNRKHTVRPILLSALYEHVANKYSCAAYSKCEGDDVLGILATASEYMPDKVKLIVSLDKDMLTIPCYHYNFTSKKFVHIPAKEGIFNHMKQTLMGDATDGYKGCTGVGKVTAVRLLNSIKQANVMSPKEYQKACWDLVCETYEKKKGTREEALVQARVAYISQAHNFDFNTLTVSLWQPPE